MDLVIFGAGGFAREVAFLVKDINAAGEHAFNLLGYLDDNIPAGTPVGDMQVLGDSSWLSERKEPVGCALAIGTPAALRAVGDKLGAIDKVEFPNLVHPGVVMDAPRISLGQGNIITAGNILTTDIRIGSFNILNLSGTWGHDVVMGDCCVINPSCSISGNVTLEGETLVGTGARILQGLTIGRGATVGSGAVVTKNVEAGSLVVGIPARPR